MSFTERRADTSDVGRVWEEAIDQYCNVTKTDRAEFRNLRSLDAIMVDQKKQVDRFESFRHSGKRGDKIRHFVNQNSDIVLSAAKQIGTAASAAFPPAATIVTAFTWIMKAAKDTSSDYDMIETFFSIMHAFLERISLLENKLPSVGTYQTMLARVFGSMLGLCAIASQYQKDGRFLKWGKALFKGSDDNLKGSMEDLNGNIQRLESATMFATLGQTIENYRETVQLAGIASENLVVTQKNLATSEETNVIVKEQAMLEREHFETSQRMEKVILKICREREKKPQKDGQDHGKADKAGRSKDAGARRSLALNRIRSDLQTTAQPAQIIANIGQSFVKGTLAWLPSARPYRDFANGTESLLLVTGERGLGKTYLASYAIVDLQSQAQDAADRTTVAYFFFEEEHEQLRSIKNFIKSLVTQIAEADSKYREEIIPDLKKIGDKIEGDDGTLIWDELVVAKYPADSESKLVLVIDGIDEINTEDRTKLLSLLAQIKKDSLQISALITSRVEIEDLAAPSLALTMDLIKKDVKQIIRARISSLSNLRRLDMSARKRIATKLAQKADSILYVEHALQRLNSLRRENLITKELRELPDSLTCLYDVLLDECRKGRTKEEFASLKRLFAWLAYSERPLTLGEASTLVRLVDQNSNLSVEEEVDGRLARLLRFAQDTDEAEQSSDENDSELLESLDDDSTNQPARDPSTWFPLRFQERALRQYFRELNVDEDGLRSSPSSAHLIIFRTIAVILTQEAPKDLTVDLPIVYGANYWIQHFLNIHVEQLSDEEVRQGIESFSAIVSNQGSALEKVEENASDLGIFGGATDLPEEMVVAVKNWTGRVLSLPPSLFSAETLSLVHEISGDVTNLMTKVARQHVYNWFYCADYQEDATQSFSFAIRALRMTNKADEKLAIDERATAEQVLYLSDAFPEFSKTSRAYRGIGLVLKYLDYYEEGLAQCRKALKTSESDLEKYHALGSILEAVVRLAGQVDGGEKSQYIREAKETSTEIAALWERLETQNPGPDLIEHKQGNLSDQAACALLEDDVESAIDFMQRARALSTDKNGFVDIDLSDNITQKLWNLKQFPRLIGFVDSLPEIEKIFWLAYYNEDIFQEAAVKSDKHQFMVDTFKLVLKQRSVPYNGAVRLRYSLALYYKRVVGDLEKSKRWLGPLVYDDLKGLQVPEWMVLESRMALAEVLMEQFRASSESLHKANLLAEMKTLATSATGLGTDYCREMSNTATVYALMVRKLGPLSEFESTLCSSFNACIEALSDDVASNDSNAIRFFGKVLACLPGLQRDAQIALAAQFYWLNPDFRKAKDETEDAANEQKVDEDAERMKNSAEAEAVCTSSGLQDQESSTKTMENSGHEPEDASSRVNGYIVKDSKDAELKDHGSVSATATEAAAKQASDGDVAATKDSEGAAGMPDGLIPGVTEDLNQEARIYCNGCSAIFTHSANRDVYTCIICTDTDLCTNCYNERVALNKGEKLEVWRMFCGQEHHYVRHAPEGWKGVKDGIIYIGEDNIEFAQWLKRVQDRWKAAWAEFWRAEDGILDIW